MRALPTQHVPGRTQRLLRLVLDVGFGLFRLGVVAGVFAGGALAGGGLALISVEHSSWPELVLIFSVGATLIPIGLIFGFVGWVAPQLAAPPPQGSFLGKQTAARAARHWSTWVFLGTSVVATLACSYVLPATSILASAGFAALALVASVALVALDGRRIVLLWFDYVLTSMEIALS